MNHLQKARWSLVVFTLCLFGVGLSVFPLDAILSRLLPWSELHFPQATLTLFLKDIAEAYYYNLQHYPFMLYSLDWLGYAHLMIALVFIGPIRDPQRNIWVIQFGQLACLLTLPAIWLFGMVFLNATCIGPMLEFLVWGFGTGRNFAILRYSQLQVGYADQS
ncbi:MAG: hypothetical protein U5L01_16485 [Rheinheimera sp.]|nr:hypothetical protein [Rheinheimera sp.]